MIFRPIASGNTHVNIQQYTQDNYSDTHGQPTTIHTIQLQQYTQPTNNNTQKKTNNNRNKTTTIHTQDN